VRARHELAIATRTFASISGVAGRLRTVTPEAFEEWVDECFASLGYGVLRTPFRGDHGVDLNVERQGEQVIV
jgi:restriction endonuclease Mrr